MDEKLIERVARAMCIADGRDPDGLTIADMSPDNENRHDGALVVMMAASARIPRWKNYRIVAARHIAGAEATNAHIEEIELELQALRADANGQSD